MIAHRVSLQFGIATYNSSFGGLPTGHSEEVEGFSVIAIGLGKGSRLEDPGFAEC
jgi:hypothetical protein